MKMPKRVRDLIRLIGLLMLVAASPAGAQQVIPALPSGIDPSALPPGLERMLRDRANQPVQPSGPTLEMRQTTESAQAAPPPPPPSLLEEEYSRRAGRPLRQIGYELFGVAQPVTMREVGAIQDSYILGVGDELLIHFRGKTNQSFTVPIDREGTVVLPELPPLPAAGLSFGEFRQQLRNEVQQRLLGTEVFASVSRIREITVTMSGELANPGMVNLSGLGSVIDAIHLAGGIKKSGTLRNVQIFRQGTIIPVDLYDFVLGRSDTRNVALADGDRIYVPVLGATLAVAGQVKRPGIYELLPGRDELPAPELLEMGGDVWVRGDYKYSVLRIRKDGTQELVELPRLSGRAVRSGEILFVEPATDLIVGRVDLAGHVRLPGTVPLASARTLRQLIDGYETLQPDPYLPLAVVEKTDPRTLASRFVKVDLRATLDGRANIGLASGDRVYVFGLKDIAYLTSADVIEALGGRLAETARDCAGVQFLARWVRANPRSDLASGQFANAVRDLQGGTMPCPELFDRVPGLLTFLMQNAVLVRGNVLNPGVYPIASREGIEQVMGIARTISNDRRSSVAPAADEFGAFRVVTQDLGRAMRVADGADDLLIRASQSAAAPPARSRFAPPVQIIPASPSVVGTSDIIEVDEPRVAVEGHIRYPGTRSLASAPTLRALIGDPDIYGDNPYLLFGLIFRRNPVTLLREIVPFAPAKVIAGEADERLQDRDIVRIFGFAEIRAALELPEPGDAAGQQQTPSPGQPSAAVQGAPAQPGSPIALPAGAVQGLAPPGSAVPGSAPGLSPGGNPFAGLPGAAPSANGAAAGAGVGAAGIVPGAAVAEGAREGIESIFLAPEFLHRLLADSSVEVLGQVVAPGRYPVVGRVTLDEVFSAAGGIAPGADTTAVEITRYPLNPETNRLEIDRNLINLRAVRPQLVSVAAGNTVRVNPLISDKERGLVMVAGEVRRPGRYDIVRGEKLSSVLERAGGLQPTAYPAGAVFTRESVERAEAAARQRTAREFHRALIGRISEAPGGDARDSGLTGGQVGLLTDLVQRLNESEAVGRMVIEANPIVLKLRPELDITLEGGDSLYVPRTPLSVFVSGEVYNPGAQQFAVNRTIGDYIEAAGGLTDGADRSGAFLIRPDGSAQRISTSSWGRGGDSVPPGSWIVIPRDLSPFRFRDLATLVTGIFRDLAVSAASLAVISRN